MHKGEVTVALARVLELVCRVNAGGRGGLFISSIEAAA